MNIVSNIVKTEIFHIPARIFHMHRINLSLSHDLSETLYFLHKLPTLVAGWVRANMDVILFSIFCYFCTNLSHAILYSYWLGSRTTAVLFDPRMDLLSEATGWGQQICSRVKQNCCCPRSQSITVLLYTFIFFFLFTLSTRTFIRCFQYPSSWSPIIWTMPLYIVTSISRDELNQWK